jgi:hypothetical protein
MFNASKLPDGSDPRAQWQQKDTKRPGSAAYWDGQVKVSEIWIDILSKRADTHSVFVIASGLHDVNFGVNADFDNGGHYEVALRRILGRAKEVWPGLVVLRKPSFFSHSYASTHGHIAPHLILSFLTPGVPQCGNRSP